MKKKIIAAFLTTAMTIGSLSGVTVFAAEAGTDEKVEMADASDVDPLYSPDDKSAGCPIDVVVFNSSRANAKHYYG